MMSEAPAPDARERAKKSGTLYEVSVGKKQEKSEGLAHTRLYSSAAFVVEGSAAARAAGAAARCGPCHCPSSNVRPTAPTTLSMYVPRSHTERPVELSAQKPAPHCTSVMGAVAPEVVLIDADLPGAEELVAALLQPAHQRALLLPKSPPGAPLLQGGLRQGICFSAFVPLIL